MLPQVPHVTDAPALELGEHGIQRAAQLPSAALTPLNAGDVSLLPGVFRERREATRAYALNLKATDIVQNHLLEAGVRIDTPVEHLHGGWEAPHCQLRGHFAGHWLSAVSRFAAVEQSAALASRASEVVQLLERCQKLNQGRWVGSIPEKYFEILARREPIWSPQYVLHKTMLGLVDAYTYLHDETALRIASASADWFVQWTEHTHPAAVYDGECAGMLELWANLYAITEDPKYLVLATRYARPEFFESLLAGKDPLTNNHANASIPWIHGAARLYEVVGDPAYRAVVERFWQKAVVERGMFATTGSNAGEFWIPPQRQGSFLGNRTQEYCTVYNMIRVADYLLRWTGEARCADYIERALYNGILAQQHPTTGLVSYFLPLQPGARKVWGSERKDFWCCHGNLVQAQSMFEGLVYYRANDGISVSQFIPSQVTLELSGNRIDISQRFDPTVESANLTSDSTLTHSGVELTIHCEQPMEWVLRVRQPNWAAGAAVVTIDESPSVVPVSSAGFLEIRHRFHETRVRVSFPKSLTREALPGDADRFALLDGPVVLAALSDREVELERDAKVTPMYEHQYVDGRDWQWGHYLLRTRASTVRLLPLHEVVDDGYCVYFDGGHGEGVG